MAELSPSGSSLLVLGVVPFEVSTAITRGAAMVLAGRLLVGSAAR